MERNIDNLIYKSEYKVDINMDIDSIKELNEWVKGEIENNKLLSKKELMKLYHLLALTNYRLKNHQDSIYASEIAITYSEELNDEYYLAKSHIWISINSLVLQNKEEFKKNYDIAENMLLDLKEYEDFVFLNIRIAVTTLRNGGTKDEISNILEKALKYITKFESPISSQMYMSIGSMYALGLNDFDFAIDMYYKSLELARYYNSNDTEALVLYYLGVGYNELNMDAKAIEIFKSILEDRRFKENFSIKAIVTFDLIRLLIDNKTNLNSIESIIKNCESFIQKLDYLKIEQYSVNLNLLKVRYDLSANKGDYSKSLDLLINCEKDYKKHGSTFMFTHVDYIIQELYGNTYFKLGNFNEALKFHKAALEVSKRYEVKYTIDSYKYIAMDYEALENYKEAFICMKEANKLLTEIEHTELVKKYIRTQVSYDRLRDQEKDKNDFFATLSHELKTPINIIYSSIQLMNLFKDKSDKDFKEYYLKHDKSVKQNCLRMLKLVHNIIDINKIDSGALKPNFINYNIVELVEEITLSVLSCVEVKGINIIFDTDIEEKYIKCDPYMIERVMLNLLSNAIKFSNDNGNIVVRVFEENDLIAISVKDNGIGISESMKEKVFDKFAQIDKSLNRKREGSGIGLSLVKLLIDIHNGYVKLYTVEGEGSEFKILLPNIEVKEIRGKNLLDLYDVSIERISTELSDIYELY